MKIALLMVAIGDLSGSGGAERYFADLHQFLASDPANDVKLVTSRMALSRLRAAGRSTRSSGILPLRLGRGPGQGRASLVWVTLRLLWVTLSRRFDIVHVCLPTPTYVPMAAVLTRLPRWMRPRVTLGVIDCTVAANFDSRPPRDLYERQVCEAHSYYFRWTSLDGVYSWYQSFADVARRRHLLPRSTVIRAARFCFTDPNHFQPAPVKDRVVVFAGRLSEQKRPLVFVDAVAFIQRYCPAAIDDWRFEMYGTGPLHDAVQERITLHGLEAVIRVSYRPDLAPVFGRSRLFVSTQADENFTSLAMLEAMAAGNAVVAEDIGQTREFVQPGYNGIVVPHGTAETFGAGMIEYLNHPERHEAMAIASRRLVTDVHTIEHFAADITSFWREVVGGGVG